MSFDKSLAYQEAQRAIDSVLEGETDRVLKMVTINALLKEHLPYYFWVGFYCVRQGALQIGPYQGTLGCLHIPFSKGVCGRAARTETTQIVEDVHRDPEHIACDSRSVSEIVVPVYNNDNQLIAVFDVDSTTEASFDQVDQEYLESILKNHFQTQVLTM
ncbi:MAG: GAF domain-containing protein [Saprospiraceae bacterium]|nr:GAF domain-containing protein [Saprospiraceae bacterium]